LRDFTGFYKTRKILGLFYNLALEHGGNVHNIIDEKFNGTWMPMM